MSGDPFERLAYALAALRRWQVVAEVEDECAVLVVSALLSAIDALEGAAGAIPPSQEIAPSDAAKRRLRAAANTVAATTLRGAELARTIDLALAALAKSDAGVEGFLERIRKSGPRLKD